MFEAAFLFMKTLFINIAEDTESRYITEAELQRVGMKADRIDAVVQDNRALAFNKSVYKAMQAAQHHDLLLFEDDVTFEPDVTIDSIRDVTRTLPDDFLTCHLGANIIGTDRTEWQMPTRYSAVMAKLHNCYMSHATLYSVEAVQFILDNFGFITEEYAVEGCRIFDDWLRTEVLSLGRSYIFKPMIAWQRPRKSAIWGVDTNYVGAHKQGNEYLSKL